MYGYDNYRKVKDEIEKKRLSAIAAADSKNEMLRATNDEIKKIDAELVKTGLSIFKAACEGRDLTPIKERNLALTKRRGEIIKSLGYPEDYTEIKYSCKTCSDSGFIDGKMCSCFREALLRENILSSGIGKLIDRQSFENFSLSGYDDDAREVMNANFIIAKRYAETFSKDSKNLLLIGPTGTGKTHLSTAIAKTVIEAGYEVLYDSAQNIMSAFEEDKFRSGFGPYEPKATKYLECDLLIIDDLGTEFISTFTLSALYNLLNSRMNKSLPTVISTNLDRSALEKIYEDRIFSRIIGADTFQLTFVGPDKRVDA